MSDYDPSYYEQVTKPARARKRIEDAKTNGVVSRNARKGPPRKYGGDYINTHIKFSGELATYVKQQATETGYQAYIEGLVRHEQANPFALSPRNRERIRNAILWHEGYIAEDEQVEQKAREIAQAAWEQYCTAIERDSDGHQGDL